MSNTADLRTWDAKLRREASVVVLAVAGLFLVASLLFFGLNDTGSGWFLWTAIVVLVLALLFEIAVVATGLAREEGGPDWLAGPGAEAATATGGAGTAGGAGASSAGQAQAAHDPHAHIDLQCPECQDLFSVHDTGERPLHTVCPHCGAEGHVDLGEPAPAAHETAEQAAAGGAGTETGAWDDAEDPWADEQPERDLPAISLKCPKCATQFDVEDTGERPLRTQCPGCGSSGKLN